MVIPVRPRLVLVVRLQLAGVEQAGLGCVAARGEGSFALQADLAGLHGGLPLEGIWFATAAVGGGGDGAGGGSGGGAGDDSPLGCVVLQLAEISQGARLDATVVAEGDQDRLREGFRGGEQAVHGCNGGWKGASAAHACSELVLRGRRGSCRSSVVTYLGKYGASVAQGTYRVGISNIFSVG